MALKIIILYTVLKNSIPASLSGCDFDKNYVSKLFLSRFSDGWVGGGFL